jgi:hypothetical protein
VDEQTLRKKQNKGQGRRSTLSVPGRVFLQRRHYHSPGVGSVTPSDELLDAAHETISLAARQLCCQLNRGSRSYEMTAENLRKAAQLDLSYETVRQVVEAEGKTVLESARSGELGPTWHAGQCKRRDDSGRSLVYLSSDAFTAPLITDAEKQSRRRKAMAKRKGRKGPKRPLPPVKRGSDQRYKEFKAVMFYSHDLEHKHISVTRDDCRGAGRLMSRDAWRLGFAAADQRVGNIDGGPWIINQIQQRRLPMTAVGLDFFHLAENVHKTRRIVFGEDNADGKCLAQDLLHTVKHEGYAPMRQKLMELRAKTRRAKRAETDRLIEYVSDRREMIRYPQFLANGWQIGSGPMESQCRVVPDRVKGSGKRWDADNAEAIMALEAMYQSGQWVEYWKQAMNRRN